MLVSAVIQSESVIYILSLFFLIRFFSHIDHYRVCVTFIFLKNHVAHSYSHFYLTLQFPQLLFLLLPFFLVWMMTLISKTLRSLLTSFAFPLFFLINIKQNLESGETPKSMNPTDWGVNPTDWGVTPLTGVWSQCWGVNPNAGVWTPLTGVWPQHCHVTAGGPRRKSLSRP